MAKKILISTGGTGGHLFPAMTLAKALSDEYEVKFVGSKLQDNPYFDTSFSFEEIDASSLSLRPSPALFKSGMKILKGFLQSIRIIHKYQPDIIVGFGSYHTFPLLVAATLLRKRYLLHEQNMKLGKVNQIFAKYASGLISHYPTTIPHLPKKKIYASMPLRYFYDSERSKQLAKEKLGFEKDRDLMLVFGGSQGAQGVNEGIIQALPGLNKEIQVLHLCGHESSIESIEEAYKANGITAKVAAFEKEMHKVLLAADFAISRAGASSCAELLEFEIPSILIPYPYAGHHQEHNADFVEHTVEGGMKLLQKEVSGSLLAKLINSQLSPESRVHYVQNIQKYKTQVPKRCLSKIIKEEMEKYAKR